MGGLRQMVRQTAPEGHPLVSWNKAGDGEVVFVRWRTQGSGVHQHIGGGAWEWVIPEC